jgi:hypothetical protein
MTRKGATKTAVSILLPQEKIFFVTFHRPPLTDKELPLFRLSFSKGQVSEM